jgi:hypothetical protein
MRVSTIDAFYNIINGGMKFILRIVDNGTRCIRRLEDLRIENPRIRKIRNAFITRHIFRIATF